MKRTLLSLFFCSLIIFPTAIEGTTDNITIDIREDTLKDTVDENITSFFLIRNEAYNGTSTDITLKQVVNSNNKTYLWYTNKTIKSFTYAGTSNFNQSDLGTVCLNVSVDNNTFSSHCYPPTQEKSENETKNETENTVSKTSENNEAEAKCEPPLISADKSIFSSQLKYTVTGTTYEYWVEDTTETVVKERRTSKTESKKRYTPKKPGGYIVRAKNSCGEDNKALLVQKERKKPYLKIDSVDVQKEEVLVDIHLFKGKSNSYAVHTFLEQDEKTYGKNTIYLKGDDRDLEVRIPLSTKEVERGEATIHVEGIGMKDSLTVYVEKEDRERMQMTSLYTRKQLFEPFTLHVHVSDDAKGYLKVTHDDNVIEEKITSVKESVDIKPVSNSTVYLVELLDLSKEVVDEEAIHISLEGTEENKCLQRNKTKKENYSENAASIQPPFFDNKTAQAKPVKNSSNTSSIYLFSIISMLLAGYGINRLRG